MLLNGYEEKVEALTAELSLREKISMIHGARTFSDGRSGTTWHSADKNVRWSDGRTI